MLSSSVWRGRSQHWFVGGLVIGGVGAALLVATVASLVVRPIIPEAVALVVVVVVAVVTVLREFELISLPLPQNARQVPERISLAGPRYGALQFGVEMGTGMRTYMTSSSPYLLLIMVALMASVPQLLLAGVGFGLGRATMTASRNAARDPLAWDAQLAGHDRFIRSGLAILAVVAAMPLAWAG